MPFTSAGAPIRESGKAILQGATDGMTEKPRKNTDPFTGEPGAHPVGTGVGAAGGAITGAALGAAIGGPTGAAVGTVVGGIAAAYGARGVAEAMNPTIQEENTSGLHLRTLRAGRVHAARAKLSDDIGPRDPDRGIGGGM